MKTVSYNGSRKAYLCPAINITEIKVETFMRTPSRIESAGNDTGSGIAETKRRHDIFNDDEGTLDTSKGIW